MEIRNYSDLTDFVMRESAKLEDMGVKKPSQSFIKYNELTLMKYIKMYDKPLYRKEKRKLVLQEALDTMPHGWVWKLFHPELWRKIKEIKLKEAQQEKKQKEDKGKLAKPPVEVPMVLPNASQFPDLTE